MKSSREQFEDWFSSNLTTMPIGEALRLDAINGMYVHTKTINQWNAWQASRQALAYEEVTTAPFVKVSE